MRHLLLFVFAAALASADAAATEAKLSDGLYAEFTTPHGAVLAELYFERTPMTVSSFVGRTEGWLGPRGGEPFFTGLRWYRVVPNFVVQSGDPVRSAKPPGAALTDEEGQAGHPFTFPDEIAPGLHHDAAGVLSMANSGPDTNSSEFFITLRDTGRLNYLHSVFGRVIRGGELLPQIKQDEPFSIKIHRVGPAAQAFDRNEAAFAARVAAAKKYAFAREPGETAHFDDPDKLLPQDVPRAQNFNFKLANFERFAGRKLYARVFAQSPSEADDAKPGAFMRGLAKKLGTVEDGVLAVYFADVREWRLWLGDAAVATFLGRTPAPTDLAPGGALHEAKQAFIAAAIARGDAFAAQAVAEGRTVSDAQRLKLTVDEVLDALILMFEPEKETRDQRP